MKTRALLPMLAAVLACACAPHAVREASVSLCHGGSCEPVADAASRERLVATFHELTRRYRGGKLVLYSAKPGGEAKSSPGVSFYVQGGPFPGLSTVRALDLRDAVLFDREKGESRGRAHADATYLGIPLFCSDGDMVLSVADGSPALSFSNLCNWMAIGTTKTRFEWRLDKVDADSGRISGHWAAKTAGLPVLGGGSGYAVGRFEKAPPPAPKPAPAPAVAAAPVAPPPPPPPPKPVEPKPAPAPVVETLSEAVDLGLDVSLRDGNGDLILDAGEDLRVDARVTNRGKTLARPSLVRLSGEPVLTACLGAERAVAALPPGESATASFSCRLPKDLPTRAASLRVDLLAGPKKAEAGARILKVGMRGAVETVVQAVSEVSVDDIPATSSKESGSRNAALVIGLSRYREKSIPAVKYAARDAQVMARYLERVAGVKAEDLKLLTDDSATRSDLQAYVEDWLPRHVTPESTVYVYYAGHGAHDDAGTEAFLVPYEGQPDFPSKMFPLKTLYADLAKLPAKAVVVMLDSCFSGAEGRGLSKAGSRPLVMRVEDTPPPDPRIAVLAGSTGGQITSDLDSVEHGLFTYYLLKGMRGEADADRDGKVTLEELYSFTRSGVADRASRELNRDQTPTLAGNPATESLPVAAP